MGLTGFSFLRTTEVRRSLGFPNGVLFRAWLSQYNKVACDPKVLSSVLRYNTSLCDDMAQATCEKRVGPLAGHRGRGLNTVRLKYGVENGCIELLGQRFLCVSF